MLPADPGDFLSIHAGVDQPASQARLDTVEDRYTGGSAWAEFIDSRSVLSIIMTDGIALALNAPNGPGKRGWFSSEHQISHK